jgi:DNA-binding beta-propeller fold protein YncE
MNRFYILLALAACSSKDDDSINPPPFGDDPIYLGVGALGHDSHDISTLKMNTIASSSDGLDLPRDLAFNPGVEGELWVVNRADDSVTILKNAGMDDQSSRHIVDPYAFHFMEEVSSIAFGAPEMAGTDYFNFGTCHESRNTYNDQGAPNDFMGPSLWSSDQAIFGISNPEAAAYLSDLWGSPADLGSHIDMLHETPLCMGIAWEDTNLYWVFDGSTGAIDRIDFVDDHGAGWDDHSDGIVGEYAKGEFARVEGVPSHMEFDAATGYLYIADTGNGAIKVLDTTSGERGSNLPKMEPGTDHYQMDDVLVWTLIDGADFDISMPSGLAIVDGHILVTDHATGIIHAFDMDGNLVDWLDTELGERALMGIIANSLDDIWIVDAKADKIIRLQTL